MLEQHEGGLSRRSFTKAELTLINFRRTLAVFGKNQTTHFKLNMSGSDTRTYEVTFCSRVAGWANALFARHPEWPFRRAEIEESKAIHRKRSDLRFCGNLFKGVF